LYHSHANETKQLERGLYGALIVRDEDELELDGERVLVLDDVKLNRRGQLARSGGPMQRHDSREGQTLLINGRTDTNLPGVLAAGDVRYGSIKRVAAAVGEGSVAVGSVHQYLTTTAPVSAW
jgi:FtsP/CotA-like multicopper oxidase with cupredoxin domain